MPDRARAAALVAASLLLLAVAAPAAAAPKSGCAADASLWSPATVDEATDAIWPALLDPSFFGDKEALHDALATYDRDGDGDICLLTMWGDALNPNSHWYKVGIEILGDPTQQFFLMDDAASATS